MLILARFLTVFATPIHLLFGTSPGRPRRLDFRMLTFCTLLIVFQQKCLPRGPPRWPSWSDGGPTRARGSTWGCPPRLPKGEGTVKPASSARWRTQCSRSPGRSTGFGKPGAPGWQPVGGLIGWLHDSDCLEGRPRQAPGGLHCSTLHYFAENSLTNRLIN